MAKPPEPRYQMLKATVISPQEPGPRLIALVSEQGAATAEPVRRLIDGADPAGEGDRSIRRTNAKAPLAVTAPGILMRSPIAAEIDYEADGKQSGYRPATSLSFSAYGWIPIPIVRVKTETAQHFVNGRESR